MSDLKPIGGTYELPMKVDVHNSAQNAFVQQWLNDWRDEFVTKEHIAEFHEVKPNNFLVIKAFQEAWNEIDTVIEEIQGTYNFEDHESRTEHFSDRLPDLRITKVLDF
jgi:hypothetical protein